MDGCFSKDRNLGLLFSIRGICNLFLAHKLLVFDVEILSGQPCPMALPRTAAREMWYTPGRKPAHPNRC